MKTQQKENLINILNRVYGQYATIRFRVTADKCRANHFNPNTLEIVLKTTADSQTVAHELAHAYQWATEGNTSCQSDHGPVDMQCRHTRLEDEIYEELCGIGIAKEWDEAAGCYNPRHYRN